MFSRMIPLRFCGARMLHLHPYAQRRQGTDSRKLAQIQDGIPRPRRSGRTAGANVDQGAAGRTRNRREGGASFRRLRYLPLRPPIPECSRARCLGRLGIAVRGPEEATRQTCVFTSRCPAVARAWSPVDWPGTCWRSASSSTVRAGSGLSAIFIRATCPPQGWVGADRCRLADF